MIATATVFAVPVSTTHITTTSIMGVGATRRLSAVRWGVAGNIVVAWVLTLPAAGAVGALTYLVSRAFGHGAVGPLVISIAALAGLAAVFLRRFQQTTPAPATS
jgi:hypothetical protein